MCRLLRKGNLYNLESLDHIVMLLKNPSLLPSLKKNEVSDHLKKNFEINDIDITLSKIHKLTKQIEEQYQEKEGLFDVSEEDGIKQSIKKKMVEENDFRIY